MPPLTVYLAGPEVFLPDAIEAGRRKQALCIEQGFVGLYPLDNAVTPDGAGGRLDRAIYRANVAMIRRADFGIVNLTPFRGPSADAGTVFELGLLTGLDKPCFGYSNAADDLLTRTLAHGEAALDPEARVWRDRDGMSIEDFGNADNLMIDACLAAHGTEPIRLAIPPAMRFLDLEGFRRCLALARAHFAGGTTRWLAGGGETRDSYSSKEE
jgi:nucleoside 2-deoxyribosyltransferase